MMPASPLLALLADRAARRADLPPDRVGRHARLAALRLRTSDPDRCPDRWCWSWPASDHQAMATLIAHPIRRPSRSVVRDAAWWAALRAATPTSVPPGLAVVRWDATRPLSSMQEALRARQQDREVWWHVDARAVAIPTAATIAATRQVGAAWWLDAPVHAAAASGAWLAWSAALDHPAATQWQWPWADAWAAAAANAAAGRPINHPDVPWDDGAAAAWGDFQEVVWRHWLTRWTPEAACDWLVGWWLATADG